MCWKQRNFPRSFRTSYCMRWHLQLLPSRSMEDNQARQKPREKARGCPNQQAQQVPAQLQQQSGSLRQSLETRVSPMHTAATILLSNVLRLQVAAIPRHLSAKTV